MITTVEFFGREYPNLAQERTWGELDLSNCKTMQDVWDTAPPDWVVWIATRRGVLDKTTSQRFGMFAFLRVSHLMPEWTESQAAKHPEEVSGWAARVAGQNSARDTEWGAAFVEAWNAANTAERAAQAAWLRENATPNWEATR